MAQKNKVKELVGRGLHSYHTKALQQVDRIEKKNKEQNHKISILSNELDNDYLTKTEEGSVISLEHSKEGMVYLDELQGNTLVNYCTDGSKEMTLNGDIDVEGSFVTTTEGVDNGKIDVLCEGNTLVNLGGKVNKQSNRYGLLLSSTMILKPSTLYTFIVTNLGNQSVQFYRNESVFNATTDRSKVVPANSTIVFTWETLSNLTDKGLIKSEMDGATQFTLDVVLLEGDWTNREIPQYFEGMKSVGQDDINGHKIEILSQNKNLCTVNSYSGVRHNKIETNIPCKKNTIYTLTFKDESDLNQSGSRGITLITHKTKTDKNDHGSIYTYAMCEGGKEYTFRESGFTFNTSDCCYISLTSNNMASVPNLIIKEIQIEEGSQTSYSPHTFNKKEILLNEPLRGLPNGVKDRFVKIGGKWFIERNCAEVILNGSENWLFKTVEPSGKYSYQLDSVISTESLSYRPNGICNKFIFVNWNNNPWDYGSDCISILRDGIYAYTNFTTVSELKTWLQNNPTKVVYELATPIYEPLEIEPTLNTYNDITHISNNSIIPCNMKIKNSGYNAIIKPSTLYTVALDTNKSGTIGMNLGGMKTVTTNNVATITTPAILSDDSLRLFGKGIKGSKVRLLEGDKTNWIPSHFEGMKSSFEDKLQEDGTYKMEILSNNRNLFNFNLLTLVRNNFAFPLKYLEVGKVYTVKTNDIVWFKICDILNGGNYPYQSTNKDIFTFTMTQVMKEQYLFINNKDVTPIKDINVLKNLNPNIQAGNLISSFVENESNKIQFSSIEPLRKWDRFVFKDGQLMIERGSKKVDLGVDWSSKQVLNTGIYRYTLNNVEGIYSMAETICNTITTVTLDDISDKVFKYQTNTLWYQTYDDFTLEELKEFFKNNNTTLIFKLKEPIYEEVPFELQKIILEGYENGTLFFDTNIPPTSTVRYAGETPIVKSVKLNKTEVLNNTNDINDNIIPYLMDMDYRVVCLQLATEEIEGGVSMARLFGGAYEMLKRDILSKRLSRQEYGYRLADYYNAGKLTEQEVRELEELR